jgi:hypothetical protein
LAMVQESLEDRVLKDRSDQCLGPKSVSSVISVSIAAWERLEERS